MTRMMHAVSLLCQVTNSNVSKGRVKSSWPLERKSRGPGAWGARGMNFQTSNTRAPWFGDGCCPLSVGVSVSSPADCFSGCPFLMRRHQPDNQRLAALSGQLESALELSLSLQAQHASALSMISFLETTVNALESLHPRPRPSHVLAVLPRLRRSTHRLLPSSMSGKRV
jgi:hypothetical protein